MFISNEIFETAKGKYERYLSSIINKYSRILDRDVLLACADIALWRCLKNYDYKRKIKFTTYLYRLVVCECLSEIKRTRVQCESIENEVEDKNNYFNSVIIDDYLNSLTDREKRIIKMRYFDNHTLEKISQEENLTKEGVRYVIKRCFEKNA
jgi:RNA polymerase sigma factor (sigma-70 family)